MQTRARSLALSMIQLGEDNQSVERQLHRWRFHPAIAHDAIRWALAHHPHREPTKTTPPKRQLVNGDAA
jgi:hypothetical protein